MWAMARPRTGAGTSAQAGWAALAARAAATKTPPSPSLTVATTSLVRAGFVEATSPPGAPSAGTPPTIEVTTRLILNTSLDSAISSLSCDHTQPPARSQIRHHPGPAGAKSRVISCHRDNEGARLGGGIVQVAHWRP